MSQLRIPWLQGLEAGGRIPILYSIVSITSLDVKAKVIMTWNELPDIAFHGDHGITPFVKAMDMTIVQDGLHRGWGGDHHFA